MLLFHISSAAYNTPLVGYPGVWEPACSSAWNWQCSDPISDLEVYLSERPVLLLWLLLQPHHVVMQAMLCPGRSQEKLSLPLGVLGGSVVWR